MNREERLANLARVRKIRDDMTNRRQPPPPGDDGEVVVPIRGEQQQPADHAGGVPDAWADRADLA